jgi:toxin ParE1/3/4
VIERLRLPAAERDLDEIWLTIARDSPAAADAMIDRIDAAEARLAEFPELGRVRDELLAGVRSWGVGAYLIFYRVEASALVAIRILHGARDLASTLDR